MGKIPWRRKWQPILVFWPGKPHGQRLVGYSPWGHKRLDTTEQLHSLSLLISGAQKEAENLMPLYPGDHWRGQRVSGSL